MCDCAIAFDIESLHAPPSRQPTATRAHPTAPITMASHIDALSALPDPCITARTNEFHHGLVQRCQGLFSPSAGDGFTVVIVCGAAAAADHRVAAAAASYAAAVYAFALCIHSGS